MEPPNLHRPRHSKHRGSPKSPHSQWACTADHSFPASIQHIARATRSYSDRRYTLQFLREKMIADTIRLIRRGIEAVKEGFRSLSPIARVTGSRHNREDPYGLRDWINATRTVKALGESASTKVQEPAPTPTPSDSAHESQVTQRAHEKPFGRQPSATVTRSPGGESNTHETTNKNKTLVVSSEGTETTTSSGSTTPISSSAGSLLEGVVRPPTPDPQTRKAIHNPLHPEYDPGAQFAGNQSQPDARQVDRNHQFRYHPTAIPTPAEIDRLQRQYNDALLENSFCYADEKAFREAEIQQQMAEDRRRREDCLWKEIPIIPENKLDLERALRIDEAKWILKSGPYRRGVHGMGIRRQGGWQAVAKQLAIVAHREDLEAEELKKKRREEQGSNYVEDSEEEKERNRDKSEDTDVFDFWDEPVDSPFWNNRRAEGCRLPGWRRPPERWLF